jgi:hypothetical protein
MNFDLFHQWKFSSLDFYDRFYIMNHFPTIYIRFNRKIQVNEISRFAYFYYTSFVIKLYSEYIVLKFI